MFWNKKKDKLEKKIKSRKKRNNSNINLLKNQKYLLKIELSDKLFPENNQEVKKIINKISVLEKNTENDFESTFPYGSFKAVDTFLKNIRDLSIHDNQQNVYLKSLELDTWEGEGKENKKKLIEVTTLEDVEIKYNFETVLKIIFEEVVNDNDTGLDIDTLKEFLSDLKNTYIKNTGIPDNALPEIPDEQVFLAQDEYYRFIIPKLNNNENKFQKEEEKNPKNVKNKSSENQYKYNVDINQKEVKQSTNIPNENKESNYPKHTNQVNFNDSMNNSTNNVIKKLVSIIDQDELANLSIYNELIDNLQKRALDSTTVAQTIELEAPQFTINKISSAKPYEPNYVEYMLNMKRQQFNIQLQNATKRLNTRVENKILRLQEHGRSWFTDEVKAIKNKYKINPIKIKETVNHEIIESKKDELEIEQKKIDTRFNNEKNLVEQDYQAKIANIERDKSLAEQRLDHDLANKYSKLEREKIADEIKKAENHSQELIVEALKPRSEVINSNLTIKYNEIKDHIANTLKNIFDELQKQLPEYEKQLQTEYLNAVETHAVELRAQDVGIQNQNVKDLNIKLTEQNKKLGFEKTELSKEISELSDKLKSLEEKLSKIPKQNQNQNEKINQQLIDLKVALDDKKKKNKRLTKEIIATGTMIGILGLSAGTAYGANQNSKAVNLKAENNRLRASRNLSQNFKKKDVPNKKKKNNSTKSNVASQNSKKNINIDSNKEVVVANSDQDVSSLINTLPKYAKNLLKNGNYSQAIKQYPEFAEVIEQKAFDNRNLEGVKTANEVGTLYGTIDEAILVGSPKLIILAYEASHITYLQTPERANAVGRAYLKRNHYNERENDYLSAVDVYRNNVQLAPLLKNDLRNFEVKHRLD